MLKFIRILMCIALICLWAVSASADVTYNFQAPGSSTNPNGYFTFTSPDFITEAMTPAGEGQLGKVFNASGVEQTLLVRFWPYPDSNQDYDVIGFGSSEQGLIWAYRFDIGAFSAYGSYSTTDWTEAHLVVSQTVSKTPIPAAGWLLGSGLLGLLGFRRKISK